MPAFATDIQAYLHEVLGISVPLYRPWSDQAKLPYFLQDAFEFGEIDLLGRPILLVMEREVGQSSIGEIRTRLDKIQSLSDKPAIYVTKTLASFQRKRLIEQKVPFIVPGNQLYLPDLGIDLREYFRQRPNRTLPSFSPSTQAILICALLRPMWDIKWQPSETMAQLGYTPMTCSRAVRELTDAKIVQTIKAGRTNIVKLPSTAKETWELALPFMRSPIKTTFWALPNDAMMKIPKRIAGISALAQNSMLAEPPLPEFAISQADWNAVSSRPKLLPEPVPGACQWQVWNYSPVLQKNSDTVDVFSLILSLQDNTDERVHIAIDELKEQLPW